LKELTITVNNPSGLHLRPAGELCRKAMKYESRIRICFRDREFDAKSLLSILSACVQQEDVIRLVCTGPDEEEAAAEMAAFIEGNTN
jgi:phosphocarrier protein